MVFSARDYLWFLLPERAGQINSDTAFNIIPFHNTFTSLKKALTATKYEIHYQISFIWNFFGNILFFLPFGFLMPFAIKKLRLFKNTLAAALIASLLGETFQLILKLGYFDIDDILLNALGAVLGWKLYLLLKSINFIGSKSH